MLYMKHDRKTVWEMNQIENIFYTYKSVHSEQKVRHCAQALFTCTLEYKINY